MFAANETLCQISFKHCEQKESTMFYRTLGNEVKRKKSMWMSCHFDVDAHNRDTVHGNTIKHQTTLKLSLE